MRRCRSGYAATRKMEIRVDLASLRYKFNDAVLRLGDRLDDRFQIRHRLSLLQDSLFGTPQAKARTMRCGAIAGAVLLIGGGIGAYYVFRPYPEPDYRYAPIDELFTFTLLKDEFNRLSIERRLELLAILRERIQGMSGSESMLLAAFAAGIMGQARDQIEENVSRLAIDIWDQYAARYESVPPEERDAYLDTTYVEFYKQMAVLSGDTVTRSDEDILREGRREAERGYDWLRSGQGPGGRMLGRTFDVMYNNVGSHSTPQQRARGTLLVRDMTRRFRGQDIATGRPLR